ncbi:uncharacterized protein LOC130932389 [Arachis stenosperma]|uniref:uncharacterized protein LOC130932389 n=1 Tax=Arachis stenosperma TaxID=217475 RepID=UPI0025ACEE4A|nr:uncharacterized protein LOC130932389 [Arachis stenosperma]
MDKKIQCFEEEIRKIDEMAENGVYDGTVEARRKALVSYCKQWYVRKEIQWKQMSRFRHAKDMDKNTRYFHNLASARRRNNIIDALIINGRLIRNQARIKIAIREFYKNLYHQERSPVVGFKNGLVNWIYEEESVALERIPTMEEIRDAIWDCESSKAQGSDGYNMNFIKKYWDEIGAEFMKLYWISFSHQGCLLIPILLGWPLHLSTLDPRRSKTSGRSAWSVAYIK